MGSSVRIVVVTRKGIVAVRPQDGQQNCHGKRWAINIDWLQRMTIQFQTWMISVKKPALYAWVDIAGEKNPFSDNYIHLRPGDPVELKVQISSRTDVDTLKRGLLQGVSSI